VRNRLELSPLGMSAPWNLLRGLMLVVGGRTLLKLLVTHWVRTQERHSCLVRGRPVAWRRNRKTSGGWWLLAVLEVRVVVENAWLVRVLVGQVVGADVAALGPRWLNCWISPVNMVVDGVLNATKAKAPVEDGAAVLLVALAEAWVLVELGQDLVERGDGMVGWEVLELLLDGLACQLLVLLELVHQAILVPVVQVRVGRRYKCVESAGPVGVHHAPLHVDVVR